MNCNLTLKKIRNKFYLINLFKSKKPIFCFLKKYNNYKEIL